MKALLLVVLIFTLIVAIVAIYLVNKYGLQL